MKKIISSMLFIALFLGGLTANAQFEKGSKIVNAGIGGGWGTFYAGASIEYGVTDFIGVGGQVDLGFYSGWFGYSGVTVPIAARGTYHFGKHFITDDRFDLYGGLALGVNVGDKYRWDSGFAGGLFAGARYFFSPKVGAFVEPSGGVNIPSKIGVTFKL